MRNLPTFHAGGALEDQLTESKLTALIDHIRSITPKGGHQIRATQTESGIILDLRENEVAYGDATTPYQMGETKYGSNTSGPGGTAGSPINLFSPDASPWYQPWGGNITSHSRTADTPDATMTNIRTDEWNRQRPPLKYDTLNTITPTNGVKVTMFTRTIITNSGSEFTKIQFARVLTFDSRGYLYNVSAETIVENDVISGSGSAGGGL